MSARDNTFIDAYGLELNDELDATCAAPTRSATDVAPAATPVDDTQPRERSYRFDAAARRRTLRGPHFDMRRAASQTNDTTSNSDVLDMNVIDVGAAWVPQPIDLQSSFDEQPDVGPQPIVEEPAETVGATEVEETIEVIEEVEEVAQVVLPAATPPETSASEAEQATAAEQPAAAEVEAPAAPSTQPSTDSAERFTPVWEVDRFNWPDSVEQLFKAQSEYFDYAGKKLVAASREGLKVLAITSTRAGEGSTTLALSLARAAAGAGATVGLLDGNLRRSELGEKLGVDFASGWQSAAAFEQPLAEAAIMGLEEGITLFPSSAGPVADIDSLGDERVGRVFRAAAASYDLLIIDAGTADLGDNVEVLDAAIVVRDIRHTSEEETLAVATALRDRGVKAVGIAENFGAARSDQAAA